MNKGLSETLLASFPDIIPMVRPSVEQVEKIDPNWLAGFTEAEGSFRAFIKKSNTNQGYAVQLKFQLTQHTRDKQLLEFIATYLECGRYEARSGDIQAGSFVVSKITDLTEKILPFFDKYPFLGSKGHDFAEFKKASLLVFNKVHLTQSGLDMIRKIRTDNNWGKETN